MDIVRGREGLYISICSTWDLSTSPLKDCLPLVGHTSAEGHPAPPLSCAPAQPCKDCPWVSSSLLVLGWNSNLEEPFLPMTQSQSNHWLPALCRLRQTEAPAHTQEPWETFQGRVPQIRELPHTWSWGDFTGLGSYHVAALGMVTCSVSCFLTYKMMITVRSPRQVGRDEGSDTGRV